MSKQSNLVNNSQDITVEGHGSEVMRINGSGHVTMPYQPAFAVGSGVNAALSPGATCPFNIASGTHALNVGGHYSLASSRFTAPVAGKYLFSFVIYSFGGHEGSFNLSINGAFYSTTNGSPVLGFKESADNSLSIGYSAVVSLSVNDYVEVQARPSLANNLYMYGPHSLFTGCLVG